MDGPSVDLDLNLVFVGTSVTWPAPKFLRGGIENTHRYHNSTLALDADRARSVGATDTEGPLRTGHVCTLSAQQMKAKREHRVPLADGRFEILDAARALGNGNSLVFPDTKREADTGVDASQDAQRPLDCGYASGRVPRLGGRKIGRSSRRALAHVVQNRVEAASRGAGAGWR